MALVTQAWMGARPAKPVNGPQQTFTARAINQTRPAILYPGDNIQGFGFRWNEPKPGGNQNQRSEQAQAAQHGKRLEHLEIRGTCRGRFRYNLCICGHGRLLRSGVTGSIFRPASRKPHRMGRIFGHRFRIIFIGVACAAGATHRALRPKTAKQLFLEHATCLGKWTAVDRLVGHLMTLFSRMRSLQPTGYLLWRPIQSACGRSRRARCRFSI